MIQNLQRIAKETGISVVFARIGEDNILVDKVRKFPCLLIPFNYPVTENADSTLSATLRVYLFDQVRTSATSEDMLPILDKLESRFLSLVNELRDSEEFYNVRFSNMQNSFSQFDSLELGKTAELTLTYYPSCI